MYIYIYIYIYIKNSIGPNDITCYILASLCNIHCVLFCVKIIPNCSTVNYLTCRLIIQIMLLFFQCCQATDIPAFNIPWCRTLTDLWKKRGLMEAEMFAHGLSDCLTVSRGRIIANIR